MTPVEIELKLSAAPKDAAKAERLPQIRAWKTGRAAVKQLHSTYFDTPDLALYKAGITLRLRRNGANHVMTVKTAGNSGSGLFARGEWEWKINSAEVDSALAASTGLPILSDAAVLNALTPAFVTQIRRRLIVLQGPDWSVEMAVDDGIVAAGETEAALSEIELELKSGPPDILFEIAEILAQALPCRTALLSKSDRGFALAARAEARPVKAKPPALRIDQSIDQAFQLIARNCLAHMAANEPVLHTDQAPEGIHQMRVALRRFRSALAVFKPVLDPSETAWVKAELKLLLAHLGPARDADVFLAEVIDPALVEIGADPCLLRLREYWSERRDRDFAAALQAVEHKSFTLLQLRLGRWIESVTAPTGSPGLQPFAAKVLRKRFRRMMNAGGKDLAHLPAPELHEVRILGKQMRYAAEFFADLFPKTRTKRFLLLQAQLQECLGGINDLTVAAERLACCRHDPDLAWAAGLIGGGHENRRPELLHRAMRIWKDLRKTEPFWENLG